jgi:hypothetical protein
MTINTIMRIARQRAIDEAEITVIALDGNIYNGTCTFAGARLASTLLTSAKPSV